MGSDRNAVSYWPASQFSVELFLTFNAMYYMPWFIQMQDLYATRESLLNDVC